MASHFPAFRLRKIIFFLIVQGKLYEESLYPTFNALSFEAHHPSAVRQTIFNTLQYSSKVFMNSNFLNAF